MIFLGVKDVHVAERPPRSRKDDYFESILAKLTYVGTRAQQLGAKAVLDAGDLIHVKEPSRVSHNLVRRLMQTFTAYPCPVLSLYGNHEMPMFNMKEARERHPKGVLYEAGTLVPLAQRSVVYQEDGVTVRVVGFDFDPAEHHPDTKPWFQRIERQPTDDYVICVAHTYAGPTDTPMPDGTPRWAYSHIAEQGNADIYFFGHEHVDQGIQRVGGKWFINNGALSRGSLTEDNMVREVNMARIDIDASGVKVTLEQVPSLSATEAFDFGEAEVGPEQESLVDFVLRLQQAKPVQMEELVSESPFSPEAKKLVLNYLVGAIS